MVKSKLLLIALMGVPAGVMAGERTQGPLVVAAIDHACTADVRLGQGAAVAARDRGVDAALSELLELHTQAVEAQGAALLPRPVQR